MGWNLDEAIAYYQTLGTDQSTLVSLCKEIQQENGGAIPLAAIPAVAEAFHVKDNYLLAVIRRIPSLRLGDTHTLQICAGPNCGKHKALAGFAQTLECSKITVKFVPCMRMCGKGPNIKFDGKLYHGATPELLRQLTQA